MIAENSTRLLQSLTSTQRVMAMSGVHPGVAYWQASQNHLIVETCLGLSISLPPSHALRGLGCGWMPVAANGTSEFLNNRQQRHT